MSSRVYESAVLINAALEDEQIQSIISHIKQIIIDAGGEIMEIEDWGRKRLAYVLKKSKIGYYAIFRFNAPPDINSKLERYYKLDESILRFLTVSLSKNALEQIEKNRAQTSPEVDLKKDANIDNSEVEENIEKPSETIINS